MHVKVDARGQLEQNGEVIMFDLGQSLSGKDINGKAAKLFGCFPVVHWDKHGLLRF